MNLKEKLAEEFYKSKEGEDLNGMGWLEITKVIYCAGFEKAREMAIVAVTRVNNMDYEAEVIAKLGEEEVE